MRQSQLFGKTERSFPKDEVSKNARLLARAGFVYKNSAGVYSFLPLGWRVIGKIAGIIREEMNKIGGQELFMPALVEKRYLDATKRWDVDIGFEVRGKQEDRSGFALGWTHEEVITEIASKYVHSYRDLPLAVYQIQTKFRNEPRAKSGLIRGREFLMKDLYSFHASEEDLFAYYAKVAEAYHAIFRRCGLTAIYTLAAGGAFTVSNTHEFQVVSEAGEDTIFVCEACSYAENGEISKLAPEDKCPRCGGEVKKERAIEAGNIFPLGTKYSEAFNLQFSDERGEKHHVIMGSYGIGLGRLMAAVVEVLSDEKGIVWPREIAPYEAHLLLIDDASRRATRDRAEALYRNLQAHGIRVLYDEREASPGEKLTDADLIGIPWRLVVSSKTQENVEIKKRIEEAPTLVSCEKAIELVAGGGEL